MRSTEPTRVQLPPRLVNRSLMTIQTGWTTEGAWRGGDVFRRMNANVDERIHQRLGHTAQGGSHVRSAEPRVTDSPRRGYTLTVSNIASSILRAIGNTPLVQLQRVVPAGSADVLVKLESVNPTGSYKDRMALAMIEGAEARGDLRPGMRVVEFTGGSTGSSLGMVCAAKGYPFVLLSSDAFAREKLLTMTAFGADLRIVPSDGGKVTPALFERFRSDIAKLAAEPDTFWTDQFHNTDALEGYAGIGRELLEQTGGRIDVFCGAVGTGGMLLGVTRALRQGDSRARIVALEPTESPAMTEGRGGPHRVEGIATGSIPPHMLARPYDEARAIDEAAGRDMARRLAREEGVLVGTSSGLNVAAAVHVARELGPGKVVVTVAVDSGLKYLAGDLFQP
jgi:cysteine synthase